MPTKIYAWDPDSGESTDWGELDVVRPGCCFTPERVLFDGVHLVWTDSYSLAFRSAPRSAATKIDLGLRVGGDYISAAALHEGRVYYHVQHALNTTTWSIQLVADAKPVRHALDEIVVNGSGALGAGIVAWAGEHGLSAYDLANQEWIWNERPINNKTYWSIVAMGEQGLIIREYAQKNRPGQFLNWEGDLVEIASISVPGLFPHFDGRSSVLWGHYQDLYQPGPGIVYRTKVDGSLEEALPSPPKRFLQPLEAAQGRILLADYHYRGGEPIEQQVVPIHWAGVTVALILLLAMTFMLQRRFGGPRQDF